MKYPNEISKYFSCFFDYFLTEIANLLISPFGTYFGINKTFLCNTGVIVGVILFFKKFSTPSITPLLF